MNYATCDPIQAGAIDPEVVRHTEMRKQLHLATGAQKQQQELGLSGGGGRQNPWDRELVKHELMAPGHEHWRMHSEAQERRLEETLQILTERPHRYWFNQPPPVFDMLRGDMIDLGLENTEPGRELALVAALDSGGVLVPGTQWRLRMDKRMIVMEPSDGSEVETLPVNWVQGVYTLDLDTNKLPWIGKLLHLKRPDIVGNIDLTAYTATPDGWRLS